MAGISMFSVPGPFVALLRWLNYRLGLSLYGRVNFTKGFAVFDIPITKEDIKALKALSEKRNPRNKHPAADEDAS